jgi:ubiquinone/menaquinone biosynthesis C-methylase UbiE
MKPDIYDPRYVKGVFDRISQTYGYTNYLASFGFTERWRKQCIDRLPALPEGVTGCDLMAGRGETWHQLFARKPGIARLIGLDISAEMIKGASLQAQLLAPARIELLEQDVFDNTIAASSVDFILCTFGLKTFDAERQRRLAAEFWRILKPGGCFSLIEVSDPEGWMFRRLYLFYLQRLMPFIERAFLGYSYGYSMIGVYVAMFGSCRAFGGYLAECGFAVELERYFFGCATGLSGCKPGA